MCLLTQANAAFDQVHAIFPQFQLCSFIIQFLAVMKLAAWALNKEKTAMKWLISSNVENVGFMPWHLTGRFDWSDVGFIDWIAFNWSIAATFLGLIILVNIIHTYGYDHKNMYCSRYFTTDKRVKIVGLTSPRRWLLSSYSNLTDFEP